MAEQTSTQRKKQKRIPAKIAVIAGIIAIILAGTGLYVFGYTPKLNKIVSLLQSPHSSDVTEAFNLLDRSEITVANGGLRLIPPLVALLGDQRKCTESALCSFIAGKNGTVGLVASDVVNRITYTPHHLILQTIGKHLLVHAVMRRHVTASSSEVLCIHALNATASVTDDKLPRWFVSLTLHKNPIVRKYALDRLDWYIALKKNGLLPWKPEDDISDAMWQQIKQTTTDSDPEVRTSAQKIVATLQKAGFPKK